MHRWDKRFEQINRIEAKTPEVETVAAGRPERNSVLAAKAMQARAAREQGQALDSGVRGEMEASFGADFSDVRVHQGGAGAARAVTRGADVYVSEGAYDPATTAGKALLGHELAHVVQQRAGRVRAGEGMSNDEGLEREADVAGENAARGSAAGVTPASSNGAGVVAVQAKLEATSESLRGTPRGNSLVKFELMLAKLDEYHELVGDEEKLPLATISKADKMLAAASKLCGQWLKANPDSDGAPVLTGLRRDIAAERVQLKRQRIMRRVVKARTHDSNGQKFDWVGKSGPLLTGKAKGAKYEGEDKKEGWRNFYNPDKDEVVTKYENEDEKKQSQLSRDPEGRLHQGDRALGSATNMGWTLNPRTGKFHGFDPCGHRLFNRKTQQYEDTDEDPRLVAGRDPETYQAHMIHHTTPVAGRKAGGGGEMSNKRGLIINKVGDKSGHFAPEGEYTHQSVRQMENENLPMRISMQRSAWDKDANREKSWEDHMSTKVGLFHHDEYRGGKKWIDEHNESGAVKADPSLKMAEGEMLLPYQAFLTSHGNEEQIRLKATLMDQIRKRDGSTKPPEQKKEEDSPASLGYTQLGEETHQNLGYTANNLGYTAADDSSYSSYSSSSYSSYGSDNDDAERHLESRVDKPFDWDEFLGDRGKENDAPTSVPIDDGLDDGLWDFSDEDSEDDDAEGEIYCEPGYTNKDEDDDEIVETVCIPGYSNRSED